MIGEIDIGGVFAPVLLIWAVIALVISLPLRRLLELVGFYRLVWHRGLFDIALVVRRRPPRHPPHLSDLETP